MAALQIFVFALALAHGYNAVQISTFPSFINIPGSPPVLLPPVTAEVQPVPLPVVPEQSLPVEPATPPCVSAIKGILQAIIDRLENLPGLTPLPEAVEPPQTPSIPELPEAPVIPQIPELPAAPTVPEVPEVQVNPCAACFEHINSLLITAQKLVVLKNTIIRR